MGEVVDLTAARDERRLLLVCDCGSTTWNLFAGGTLECANCEEESPEQSVWHERLPPVPKPDEAVPSTEGDFRVLSLDTSEVWLKRKLAEWKDIVFAMVAFKDGSVSTFAKDLEGENRRSWVRRRLVEAGRLTGVKK